MYVAESNEKNRVIVNLRSKDLRKYIIIGVIFLILIDEKTLLILSKIECI